MNNHLRFRFADYFEQQCFIEYIHERWLNAEVEKHGGLLQRTRRANHRPTLVDEQPAEPASDSPTRSCDKYSFLHASIFSMFANRYSTAEVRQNIAAFSQPSSA